MSKAFVSTCVLAALVCALTVPATAHTPDRRTLFTFNQPIALPGVTLPAGTYTFRVADPTLGGRVVQVLNHSGTQNFAMLLSIPTVRRDMPGESEITFMETAAGMPAAVKVWWQEGSTRGHEFIYPKEQIERLTQGVLPVPADFDPRPTALANPDVARPPSAPAVDEPLAEETAEARDAVRAEASSSAAQAQGRQGAQPAPSFAQEPTESSEGQGTRQELPRTASMMPLALLVGALMLVGGGWLTRKAKA
jgi:LPXTG-motif cell wall-anchored protein